MVRLVFRPYTQLRRSICTSESLRSSIRVSPDFDLARHSSPSFGSHRVRSCCSARCEAEAKRRDCAPEGDRPSAASSLCFHCAAGFSSPLTRAHGRLLGPCFKTGRRRRRPTRDEGVQRCQKRHALYAPDQTLPAGAGGERHRGLRDEPPTSPRAIAQPKQFVASRREECSQAET